MCKQHQETHQNLFIDYTYTMELSKEVMQRFSNDFQEQVLAQEANRIAKIANL